MTLITRDVVHDLWVLYSSGEASEDTRKLVDDFLAGDPELARSLREATGNPLASLAPKPLPPDHELRTLDRIKRRLWGYQGLMQLALIFSGLAFGRIVSDTSWDVSPRRFIITAAIAAGFWIAFFVTLYRGRRSIVVRLR
jgi:hypothetical protein